MRDQSGNLRIRPGHIVIGLLAVVLAISAVVFFRQTSESTVERDISSTARVVVAAVETRDVELEVEAIGRVLPWREVSLAPEVSGRVLEVPVEIGDRVRAGEVVLRIDPGPHQDTVREREADQLRAQARLEESEASLDRMVALRDRGAISEREYDAALAQKRAAEADLKSAQASLARAERQLADCELQAPFTGSVVERRVDPGALVGPERTVLGLADLQTVAVEVGLTEQELLRVRSAQTALIESSSLPGRVVEGTIDGIAERSDPATGTYEVRIRADNREEPGFLGGMVVDVRIPWSRLEKAVTIPAEAIVNPGTSPHLWVVRNGTAIKVPVRVIARVAGSVVIEAVGVPGNASANGTANGPDGFEFLKDGDDVVIVGQTLLEDGLAVEVASRR